MRVNTGKVPAALLAFVLFAAASATEAAAGDLALGVSPWSFAGGCDSFRGTFAGVNLAIGLTPRLELGLYGFGELTPAPGSSLMAGAALGLSLAGPRDPTYFNVMAELGSLVEYRPADGRLGSALFFARLSPLVIGNAYSGHRDRIFSLGLAYDVSSGRIFGIWNILILEWFLGPRPKE